MSAIFSIVGTFMLFLVMRYFYIRYSYSFLHPVLTSTMIVCVILVAFKIPYATYMEGAKWINELLGACVVALALPLYNQRNIILKYKNAILLGISSGLFTAMGSIVLFAKLLGVEDKMIYTLLPKSITTPVAIQLSETMSGMPSLTAVFVMLAGFSGIIIGPYLLKWMKIKDPLSVGIAFGSASHALGVAKSSEYGELSLSMASVSMTLSAISGAIIGPLIILFI